jgi:hypothetical protein
MKRKLVKMQGFAELTGRDLNVIASYHGWLSWCDSYRLAGKYVQPLLVKPRLVSC